MTQQAAPALIGAVDLGGTKILSLIVDDDGQVRGEDLRPTDAHLGPEAVLARVADSVRAAAAAAGGSARLSAAGVAAPGPIDAGRGVVVEAPNLPGWRDVPAARRLSELLGIPALLENDANAAAWGEFRLGAARGATDAVYITVSTGIGGGLVLDGRLYRGARGGAGELGHIPLVDDGPLCGCGAHGCLEQLASGTAIAREARALLSAGRAPVLARLQTEHGGEVTAELVLEAAQQGDADARQVITRAGHFLGRGLTTAVNLFNPDVIVLGGGVTKMGPPLLDPALSEMQQSALRLAREHVRVVTAALGDRAGALGAAMLARALVRR